jgi:hypothetical protein
MSNIEEFGKFTKDDIEEARNVICKNAPDHIIRLILHRCAQLGCDPMAKMIYAVERKGVWTLQASIDLFRSTLESSPGYAGQDGPYWCGDDGVWVDVWLKKEHPRAAKVGVYRQGFMAPLYTVANWESYAQTGVQGFMWEKFGPLMIAKCAEALCARRACPAKLSGIYSQDEMNQADGPKHVVSASLPHAFPNAGIQPQPLVQETYAAGKQLGKLRGAVDADMQRLGGDVLALKAEYENALSQKNPRGTPDQAVAAPVIKVENNSVSNNEPAVDGEAGTYTMNRTTKPPQLGIDLEIVDDLIPEAPASEKTQAVMAVMTHTGFEREFPKYEDKMKVCSDTVGRTITAWSQLTPEDCANVLGFLQHNLGPQTELATDSEIVQLQIHLKDADIVAYLKKSKAYLAAQEEGATQADSLRNARLAFAGWVLGHPVASFKELTSAEVQTLFAKFQSMKSA